MPANPYPSNGWNWHDVLFTGMVRPVETDSSIVVGISGGVDSAVAALRLQASGCVPLGLFMKNWEEDDTDSHCAAEEDLSEAQAVCDFLDITLHTVNFSSEYWDKVFKYFLAEYKVGRTPNPDVLCNSEIKFRSFLDHAMGLGADHIATGHYARVTEDNGIFQLRRSVDDGKDQTYFLHQLNQHQLSHALFPLGDMNKTQVRDLARSCGLPNHDRKDSTGICFIGEHRFREFLARFLPEKDGEIQTPEGEVIGQHKGVIYYTLGQREGLGIGGRAGRQGEPWYVVDKQIADNVLVVVQGHEHPLLFSNHATTTSMHWIGPSPDDFPLRCHAQARHRQPPQPCTVELADNGIHVTYETPQRALTPGQSLVLYQADVCLGGAPIASTGAITPLSLTLSQRERGSPRSQNVTKHSQIGDN